jgi:hypothetical protein
MTLRVTISIPPDAVGRLRAVPIRLTEDCGPYESYPNLAVLMDAGTTHILTVRYLQAFHMHLIGEATGMALDVTVPATAQSGANFVPQWQGFPLGEFLPDFGAGRLVRPTGITTRISLFAGHAMHMHEQPTGLQLQAGM